MPFRASLTLETMCSNEHPSSAKAPASWHQRRDTFDRSEGVTVTAAAVSLYLMYEDGSTEAPPARFAGQIEGAVVGYDHHVDGHALVARLLRRQAEVETVASVVLHDEEDSRCSWERGEVLKRSPWQPLCVVLAGVTCVVHTQNGRQDASRRRRRKHGPRHRRRQHSGADVTWRARDRSSAATHSVARMRTPWRVYLHVRVRAPTPLQTPGPPSPSGSGGQSGPPPCGPLTGTGPRRPWPGRRELHPHSSPLSWSASSAAKRGREHIYDQ